MSDFGRKIADKKIKKVDRQLRAEFRQAEKELNEKLADFVAKHQKKGQKKWQQLVNGEITQAQYHSWMQGQVFQRKQWEAKIQQCQQVMHEHNVQAAKIVHENKLDVFAESYNHAAYETELELKGVPIPNVSTSVSFNLMNEEAVARLVKERPQLLPEWKIVQPKDYKWNARKVNNAITQGIIQGESVDKVAKRLTHQLCTANEKKMRMFARTAMGGAMCAGEQVQMEETAKRLKIDIAKEWLATLDSRTRDAHRELDGQLVPYDEPFQSGLGEIMFPCDPKAEPGNIYNCRCSMVKRYPKHMKTNDWRQQETIDGMSYEEWKKGKKGKVAKGADDEEASGKGRPNEMDISREKRLELVKKGVEDVNGLVFSDSTAENPFPTYASRAKPNPKYSDFVDVIGHGTPTTINMKGERIDGYTLAGILWQKDEYENGRGIRLIACQSGRTDETGDCIAQILANEMNVKVLAPVNDVLASPSGKLHVLGYLDDDEGWKLFYPRGKQK